MSEVGEMPQVPEGQLKPGLREKTNAFFGRLLDTHIVTKAAFSGTLVNAGYELLQGNFVGAAIRMGIGTAVSIGAEKYTKGYEARLDRQSQELQKKFADGTYKAKGK